MTDYSTMNGPELVQEYNRLATERGLPLVKRFATIEAGRRRLAAMSGEAPPNANNHSTETLQSVFDEFNTSERKLRGRLIKKLWERRGHQVPLSELMQAVYGNSADNKSALGMVLRGFEGDIKKKRYPREVRKVKASTGEISYGLYDKT